ncbi:hypothetical protein CUMW_224870, partial [Citrus unshiu]
YLSPICKIEISVFNGFSKPRLSSIFVDWELHKSHIISRGRGKERPKLARIPWVMIDGKFIYDPESEVLILLLRSDSALRLFAFYRCLLRIGLRMNAWSGVFDNISAVDESLKKCLHFLRPNTGLIQNSTCPRKYDSRQSHNTSFPRDLEKHLKMLNKLDKLQDALAPKP